MIRLALFMAIVASPALAQDAGGEGSEPPQKVRSVILYGDDKCPAAAADEIVVCHSGGESPFRIPKSLRKSPERPANTSWVRRAELIDEVNRATLPGSCNPIGSNGQTGCTLKMLQQWKAEQAAKKAEEANIPRAQDE
ncbi:hypothetical protein [Sphingomonas sp.]|uniref:hypothetical protein n=1 Tax=Sphingomonas sp. TaxID=28214 RepID=UPI001EB94A4A|nr:hypothetical protein [Sphingomonas sp.]MBX3593948.1 hypothetical protein [Sphingomonas sp.]